MSQKLAKEAHAYTPGLKVKQAMIVKKTRILPIRGDVLVKAGDEVEFDTIVARTELPGEPHFVNAMNILRCEPDEVPSYMIKKEGDPVKKDEVMARFQWLFGLIKLLVKSPVDGVIENVSNATGRIIVRADPIPVEVKAYIPGEVIEILPQEGVIVETNAAFIQGILGVGGETHGEIVIAVDSPKERLTADDITQDHKGKVVIGGSLVTGDALKKAMQIGAKAVVIGGIEDVDLIDLLGYELGVAITGHEDIPLSLVITEGYGEMAMAQRTFELFKTFEGVEAAVNGETQIRAGVLRPEIVIPQNRFKTSTTEDELTGGMRPGTPLRVIREPFFGRLATVVSLPVEKQKVETESSVRVMEIELEDGERVVVPRANVEIIEQ